MLSQFKLHVGLLFWHLCTFTLSSLKPFFHLANLFARREAKTRIQHRDWLKLAGEKIRREQVRTVPTFLSVRANKFVKWKISFSPGYNLIFCMRIVFHSFLIMETVDTGKVTRKLLMSQSC